MGYAIVEEVEVGFRTLTRRNGSGRRPCWRKLPWLIDAYGKDADPDVKRLVSCRMVRRLLGDGTGGETPLYPMGATQGSATALGYTQSWTMGSSGSAGELYLSKLEKKLLGRATASARPAQWRGFAMLRGIDVVLYEKHQTGEDAFHAPVYEETPVTVHNVLVGAPDTAAIVNELTLTGRRLAYTLALPKGG